MSRPLASVLKTRSYERKYKKILEKFNNKYRHTGTPFSLNLGQLNRFDLIGCQGISGWSGSLFNSSSFKNVFSTENEQWQVAMLALENRNRWRVSPDNFRIRHGVVDPKYQSQNVMKKTVTLLLGDNFYSDGLGNHKLFSNFNPSSSKTFAHNFTNLPYDRSLAILGNHDWGLWSRGGKDDSEYKLKLALNQVDTCYDNSRQTKDWHMPNRYYHFTTDEADFYCIDSTSYIYDLGQRLWLNDVYNKQQQANPDKWQILVSHHPLVSIGKRNPYHHKAIKDAYKYSKFLDPSIRKSSFRQEVPFEPHNQKLKQLISRFKFDVVLSAHDHTLAGYYIDNDTFQVVSGGGGANIEPTPTTDIKPLIKNKYIVSPSPSQNFDKICQNKGYFLQDSHGYVCMYIHNKQINFHYHWLGNGYQKITVSR